MTVLPDFGNADVDGLDENVKQVFFLGGVLCKEESQVRGRFLVGVEGGEARSEGGGDDDEVVETAFSPYTRFIRVDMKMYRSRSRFAAEENDSKKEEQARIQQREGASLTWCDHHAD